MGIQLSKTSHLIIFLIVFPLVSAAITYILNSITQKYVPALWIIFVDTLGVLGTYTLIFKLFNDCIWQLLPQGFLGIVDVPNLNGTWKGELRSSFNGNAKPYAVTVKIIQTFSTIKIFSYFQRSWSYSIVADFYKEHDGRQVLHYVYKNEPRNNAVSTMHGHYGASKHEFVKIRNTMECSYYNEPPRDRGWYGKFDVKRTNRTLTDQLFPTLIKTDFE